MKSAQVLLTAFSGTSAEQLVRGMGKHETLFLPSDRVKDSEMLISAIDLFEASYIFAFGQKPNIKDKVCIETTGREGEKSVRTGGDCGRLKVLLEEHGIATYLSDRAGTSYCNCLYWNGLNHIVAKGITAEMIFLHVPFYEMISDFKAFQRGVFAAIEDYADWAQR